MPNKASKNSAATKFVAHFSTSGKVDVVENWLKQNIAGEWVMRTEGVSEDLSTKRYQLVFSRREDYLKFRSRFSPGPAKDAH